MLVIFCCCAVSVLALQDASTPARTVANVNSAEITLRDEKRGREIECRVYSPRTGERLPLIIFSHGFGGDRTAFAAISQHVAEHGFVIVHPSHVDGFGRSGSQEGVRGFRGLLRGESGGLVRQLEDPAKIEGRISDIKCILDSVSQLENRIPALNGRIDSSRIGVGGHSYGAYTAMLIGGVTVDLDGKAAVSFGDPRVRCILPVSGQGIGQQGLTEESWAKLKLPMLTITGSRDQGAGGQKPDWKKDPYKFSPPGDKYLVFIDGANHFSFGGFGGRETDVTRIVKAASLAFWKAYLKDDEQAKIRLKSPAADILSRGAAIMSK
jgi:predicted dienelactone hydrolase